LGRGNQPGHTNRWGVLALLFSVRVSMAFQFQAVAALSPIVMREFNIGIADLGLLIGLYLSPGIILAFPGGKIGKRFGDKPAVMFGLVLMVCGGMLVALSPVWGVQIGGRLLAGVGGVILNVLMSKMVTDWFDGREIATAMGIFVNSWPVGIALALVVLPPIAEASSLMVALLLVTGLAVASLLLFAALYRAPALVDDVDLTTQSNLRGVTLAAVITAGLIWGLYNAALGMVFSFGPAMLAERGWSNSAAGSVTSLVLWLVAISVPLGGVIADRSGQRNLVLVSGLLLFAVMLILAARTEAVFFMFVLLGLVGGLSAGPIMSLPSAVLHIENRAIGMGIFFTMFYLTIVLAPLTGSYLAGAIGRTSVTFDMGAIMLIACCAALWLFRRFEKVQSSRSLALLADVDV
jgi:MFS family permease